MSALQQRKRGRIVTVGGQSVEAGTAKEQPQPLLQSPPAQSILPVSSVAEAAASTTVAPAEDKTMRILLKPHVSCDTVALRRSSIKHARQGPSARQERDSRSGGKKVRFVTGPLLTTEHPYTRFVCVCVCLCACARTCVCVCVCFRVASIPASAPALKPKPSSPHP